MDGNRQLDFTLSLGYVLTALIIAYFYFSPTVINPLFSDILIVLGVLLLLSCLIFASVKAKSPRNIVLVLFGIMLFSRHEDTKKLEHEYDRNLSVIYDNGELKIYKVLH